jgi:hypothetical protein
LDADHCKKSCFGRSPLDVAAGLARCVICEDYLRQYRNVAGWASLRRPGYPAGEPQAIDALTGRRIVDCGCAMSDGFLNSRTIGIFMVVDLTSSS